MSEILTLATDQLLLWEASSLTRVSVEAAEGTKAGTFVDFPLRSGAKLVALTDAVGGKVQVQPHNCIVNTKALTAEAIAATGKDIATLNAEGDPYGVIYDGVPVKAAAAKAGDEK